METYESKENNTGEEESVTQESVTYIENPLPLPKKHVKKDLDFQYQVAEDKMKFDIEVSDEDDFDI